VLLFDTESVEILMENNSDTATDNQSPQPGARLLVPVSLQALVVNSSYMSDFEWSIAPNNYKNLANFQIPVEPPPFTLQRLYQPNALDDVSSPPDGSTYEPQADTGSPPSSPLSAPGIPWTGVILHWTLPNALTHGTQSGTGSPPSSLSSPVDDDGIRSSPTAGSSCGHAPIQTRQISATGKLAALRPGSSRATC
jgi:hypothetical protein